jgi:hypothetical protein
MGARKIEKTQVSFCPHCGHDSQQSFVTVDAVQTSTSYGDFQTVAKCGTCSNLLIYATSLRWHSPKTQEFGAFYQGLHSRDLIYPRPDNLHRAVPEAIARQCLEAAKIKNIAPNAFASSIRRCLETVCSDRGASDATLQKQLAELEAKGDLSQGLAELTEVIRLLGNSAAHDDVEIDATFVDTIDEFFRAVLDYVYVRPFQVKEIKAKYEHAKKARKSVVGRVS